MSDTLMVRLDSLVDVDPENLPATTPSHFSFNYIDISAVSEGRIDLPPNEVTFSVAPSRARRVIRTDDVLMATVRPNLKAFSKCDLPSGNFVASTGFAVLRSKAETDPRFILAAILSDDVGRQIESMAVGSNYPAINTPDVRRLSIPALLPGEQLRIGVILGTVEDCIRKTDALIAKYQQIKAGLMHDLFTRGLMSDGHLRPPSKEASQLYKDSPLGLIPNEWAVRSFSELVNIERGYAFHSEDYREDGMLNFRVSNVGMLPGDLDNTQYLPRKFWDEYPSQQLFGGEIVIVMVGATTGKVGRVPVEICPSLLNQNLWHLNPGPEITRDFLWYSLSGIVGRHMRMSQGSARDFLKQSDFGRTPILFIGKEEQAAISSILTETDNRLLRESQTKEKLVLEKRKKNKKK